MAAQKQDVNEGTQELRALLARVLVQADADPRLEQMKTALEQAVRHTQEGLQDSWKRDLAAVKSDLREVRELLQRTLAGSQPSLPQIQQLLERSDAQLETLLKATQTQLGEIAASVRVVTEKVARLEGLIQKPSGP
jgi:ABC-type transporter Mla subunit MlaD